MARKAIKAAQVSPGWTNSKNTYTDTIKKDNRLEGNVDVFFDSERRNYD